MPQKTFDLDRNDLPAASKWLYREPEELGRRATKILYPGRFAIDFGITEDPHQPGTGRCRGVLAEEHRVVPYKLVIEYDD